MRSKGTISRWDDDRGFGFITPTGGGKAVFVHISAFGNIRSRPRKTDSVSFSLGKDRHGRPCAQDVDFAGASIFRMTDTLLALFIALAVLGGLFTLSLLGKLPWMIPLLFVSFSVVAFIMYGLDKSAAQNSRWRTAENTLHLLSFLGGWPGALVAQRFFRHKSRKHSFQLVFWLLVLVNCVGIGWVIMTHQ